MKAEVEALFNGFRAARRYRWWAIGCAWVVLVIGSAVVLMLPNQYESRAQIYVDTSTMLKPLLQGIAVAPSTEAEVEVLRRALLARPTIERVARETGYLKRAKDRDEAERLLVRMTANVQMSGDPRSNAYFISFVDYDPRIAHDVVASLLDSFVRGAQGADRSDAEGAQRFLEQQVDDYSRRLSESEAKLADFKKLHLGMMPTERGDYFQRMQNEQLNADKLRSDRLIMVRQRDELRRKLAGQAVTAAPVEVANAEQIQAATAIDSELRDKRRQLDDLLLKFTDVHPDVVALKETIARLAAIRARDFGNVRATSAGGNGGTGGGVDNVLQQLQIQLDQADLQVASLDAQIEQSSQRVSDLRKTLSVGPEIEAQLQQLNRDYGVTKAQYEALLQRLENARVSGRAESTDEVRMRVLDPPRTPTRPQGPKRVLLLLLVTLVAIGGGGLLAWGLSAANPVFMSRHDLAELTGLAVIGVIGSALPEADQARAARAGRAAAVAVSLLLAVSLALCATAEPLSNEVHDLLLRMTA